MIYGCCKCFQCNSISGLSNGLLPFVWTRVLCLFGFFSLKWEVELFAYFSLVVTITVCVIGRQQASHCRKSGPPVWVIQVVAHAVVFPVALDAALGSLEVSRTEVVDDGPLSVDQRQCLVDCVWVQIVPSQLIGKYISVGYSLLKRKLSLGRLGFESSNVDSVADFMSCCWVSQFTSLQEKVCDQFETKNAHSLFDQIAAGFHQYSTQVVDVNVGHGTSFRSG